MAQRIIDSKRVEIRPKPATQLAPDLGLRGGLGKTLLTAFLLLTTLPLSLLAFLTYNQIQRDTHQKSIASLETMVSLKEAYVADWVESYERDLVLLAGDPDLETHFLAPLEAAQAVDPTLTALALLDRTTGKVIATTGHGEADLKAILPWATEDRSLILPPTPAANGQPLLAVSHEWADRQLVGLLQWDSLWQIITASDGQEDTTTHLITGDGLMISERGMARVSPDQLEAMPQGILLTMERQSGSGAYNNPEGTPVFGAYRWNPKFQIALLAEQPQIQALQAADTLTAVVVGGTLAVALITVAIAAVVTRRLTRPIVQLTETAAWMARGNLDQKVSIVRRDEIGILARAFNRMAAELRVLYHNLESKVAERTAQLEKASTQTRYYAMQLAISAEVARVASSIRDPETMLSTVVDLIGQAFELHHVAIYLLDDSGEWAVWQVASNTDHPLPERVAVDGPTLVGHVMADGQRRVVQAGEPAETKDAVHTGQTAQPPAGCEMAVPLRIQARMLGALYLQSSQPTAFGSSDQIVYQSLADQISIAIENARAYALERETVAKLQELDRIQAQFLTNMSHALRTPLTSVMGFSQIMLKELDGPLTDLQRTDLNTIHESGQQLLGLINDMLELSHLELGTAPFTLSEVNLAEIIEGVMATARALARGKSVQLREEIPEDLPPICTDRQRLRQVILALLANAIKFTDEGSVCLCVATEDNRVVISVQDTGIGITEAERARIFSNSAYGEPGSDEGVNGFGLAISKRVVERLGGRIWVKDREGKGSTFTFTLPIRPAETERVSRSKDKEAES